MSELLLSIELIRTHLKVIIFFQQFCVENCVSCMHAHMHEIYCVCVYAWVCKMFILYLSIYCKSSHILFCSGAWTLYFFFLQTWKLSAKTKFLFLILAKTWYRLPLQFHPVCITHRLMVSDSLRDTLQASDGKMPPAFSLTMDLSFI